MSEQSHGMSKPEVDYVLQASWENCSNLPVKTARYTIEIAMNEAYFERNDEEHKQALAAEFQRALDAGFFEDMRYNAITFEVTKRVEIGEAPANEPELSK